MKIVHRVSSYVILFVITCVALVMLLVATAKIPKTAIRENMLKSAELLEENDVFFNLTPKVRASKIDRYADSILLNIAYNYDSEHPLKSVLWSKYYSGIDYSENTYLRLTLSDNPEPNTQYLRYWHGSNVLVRPLHTILSLKQIYILFGIMILLLFGVLTYLLIKSGQYVTAVAVTAGMAATSVWYVPYSLEYVWMYLLMLITSIVVVVVANRKQYSRMGYVFLVAGMLTSYFDFLTSETLSLTVPMLIGIRILFSQEKYDEGKPYKKAATWAILWLAGYVGMWVMKWMISSIVLGENVLPYVVEHIKERTVGDMYSNVFLFYAESIWRNITCLFPLAYGIPGKILFAILIVVTTYIIFVYRKKNVDKKRIWMFAVIGLIPIIRYIVLGNHSILHSTFTYRALFATVMSLIFIIYEVIDITIMRRKRI